MMALVFTVDNADAKKRKRYKQKQYSYSQNYVQYKAYKKTYKKQKYTKKYKKQKSTRQTYYRPQRFNIARPAGCPRLWCGCYMALKVFGKHRRDLWYAKNWLKFPRTSPSPGAIAVLHRPGGGHVGIVQHILSNGDPVLKSGNTSGGVAIARYSKYRVIAYVKPV